MDHGGERPYPCPECAFTCKTKQQLNEHRRKHSVRKNIYRTFKKSRRRQRHSIIFATRTLQAYLQLKKTCSFDIPWDSDYNYMTLNAVILVTSKLNRGHRLLCVLCFPSLSLSPLPLLCFATSFNSSETTGPLSSLWVQPKVTKMGCQRSHFRG